MQGHDILIAIFTGILKALDTFIAMYHVMVAQQSFYVICAVQFLACLSPMCPWSVVWQAGGQQTWLEHGIEMSGSRKEMHGIFSRAPHSKGQESYPACWSAAVCTCTDALQQFTQTLCRSALPLRVRLSMLCSIALPRSERLSAGRIQLLLFECGRCLRCAAALCRSRSCTD